MQAQTIFIRNSLQVHKNLQAPLNAVVFLHIYILYFSVDFSQKSSGLAAEFYGKISVIKLINNNELLRAPRV